MHERPSPASPLITIGPRVRKSPYFDATLRWGAKAFTVYNHVYMPTHYGDPVEEYWSLVRAVTLWDVSCQRQIRISGRDAKPFVELLTPRDLSHCPSHQCLYVLLTDQRGGIVNDEHRKCRLGRAPHRVDRERAHLLRGRPLHDGREHRRRERRSTYLERRRLAEGARLHAHRFGWDVTAERTLDCYADARAADQADSLVALSRAQ